MQYHAAKPEIRCRPAPVAAAVRRLGMLACAGLLLLATGCGGDDAALLGSYIDELEFDAPLESSATVELGKFNVPTATTFKRTGGDGVDRHVWMRVRFELYAETSPKYVAAVEDALRQHRGALNDAVLSIVRSSSTDELTDPRCTALRMRLTEAARPLLGNEKVRQLVLYRHATERL